VRKEEIFKTSQISTLAVFLATFAVFILPQSTLRHRKVRKVEIQIAIFAVIYFLPPFFNQTRSMIIEDAPPPPLQIAARPMFALF